MISKPGNVQANKSRPKLTDDIGTSTQCNQHLLKCINGFQPLKTLSRLNQGSKCLFTVYFFMCLWSEYNYVYQQVCSANFSCKIHNAILCYKNVTVDFIYILQILLIYVWIYVYFILKHTKHPSSQQLKLYMQVTCICKNTKVCKYFKSLQWP